MQTLCSGLLFIVDGISEKAVISVQGLKLLCRILRFKVSI